MAQRGVAAWVAAVVLVGAGCAGSARDGSTGTARPIEVVATMDRPPGNVAVAPDGRIFVSMHPFGSPERCVREVLPDGSTRVFPPGPWGGKPGADGVGIASVIGIECDTRGTLWALDMGGPGLAPRLLGWDLKGGSATPRVVPIPPPASVEGGFPQDLAIDEARGKVYVADMGMVGMGGASKPAIIVVDLASGGARRVLEDHPALRAEPGAAMVVDGVEVTALGADGKPYSPANGLNPITIDARAEWVYFGAMHGRTIHRVRAADLADASLGEPALAARVERFGPKPVSDGITIDSAGNVYATDVNASAIGATSPDGRYRVVAQDARLLSWPDGLSFGPDGRLYATVNQLHRHAPLSGGRDRVKPGEFYVVRVTPLAPGAQGR